MHIIYDVLNITEVIHAQRQLQNPKSLLENAEDPNYYFEHGLAPAYNDTMRKHANMYYIVYTIA